MPLERSETLVANGINAVTGDYALPEVDTRELAARLRSGGLASTGVRSYQTDRGQRLRRAARALDFNIHAENIREAGWGIVFHRDESDSVKSALRPLLEHRREQIGNPGLVRELVYRPGDSIERWLAGNNVAWGNVDPYRVPYYLLLVGSPDRIPLSFIHALDAEYCVGLLAFDAVDDYERYVASVIDYEKQGEVPNKREIAFFGTQHAFDRATNLSANWLVAPLADGLPASGEGPPVAPVTQAYKFGQTKVLAKEATRQALLDIMKRSAPPAILFTATHGMIWPKGHPDQLARQGALLCQDWNGVGDKAREHYLAAEDVPADARLSGVIGFLFACFGAGTPDEDRFVHQAGIAPPQIAPKPFLARLPQTLLAHPRGGMLACIGHIERAWHYSIIGQSRRPQIQPFQKALGRLMVGHPIGLAAQEFNDRCALASVALTNLLEQVYARRPVDDTQLALTWAERNDAEGYVVIGDPAVRLRVEALAMP